MTTPHKILPTSKQFPVVIVSLEFIPINETTFMGAGESHKKKKAGQSRGKGD